MSDSEIKKDSNLKKWNCFIKSVYQEDFSVDTIFKSRKSINSFAVTAFSVGGSVGLSKDEYSDDQNLDIVSTIDAVSKALEELIINYVGTRKYLITLDELDETWTAEEKNKYKNVLIGLFSECFRMNNDFNEKAKTNQIKICPFVRTEIYDDLAFNDKNKIREGKSIEIMWTAKTLDEMFFTRVQYYKQRWNNDNLNKQVDIQKEAFSSDQSTRIFNQNSVKHQISPFRHVLRSSFYRPRDIISYMNKIRDSHKRAESQEFKVYTSADLRNAEKDYSRAMYRELVDEFSPLEEKYHFNSLADALRKIKYQTFSYNKFNIVYQAICSEDTTKGLEFLFSISALGQRVGNNYKYRFDDPFLVMDESKMFYVNPAIKWSLNIVEGTAK